MGVPYLFAMMRKRYPSCVKYVRDSVCDSLFLDWNGGIHIACRNVLEEISTMNVSGPELERKMIQRIVSDLHSTIEMANPQKLVYIAIDGVAPSSKISHQRKRRYKTVKDKEIMRQLKKQYNISDNTPFWDSNSITPGTNFMKTICQVLKTEIEQAPQYKNINIILSNADSPGEGEQKIIQYIRSESSDKLGHCWIHGLDADFIFLTLLTSHVSVTMWRDDPKQNCFLEIDELRKLLVSDLSSAKKESVNVIKDLVFLSNLLGNDFLPGMLSLPIFPNGFDTLIRIYKQETEPIVKDENVINLRVLHSILSALKLQEEESIRKRVQRWKLSIPPTDLNPFVEAVERYEKNFPRIDIFKSTEYWVSSYYKYHNIQNKCVKDVCHDYLNGMKWVLDYYTGNSFSWKWFYKYDTSPLLRDILTHMEMFQFVNMDIGKPVPQDVQLMCVLPPQSQTLLKRDLQNVMKNAQHLCPTQIDELTWCKDKRHEGIPRLPKLSIGFMIKLYIDEMKKTKKQKY